MKRNIKYLLLGISIIVLIPLLLQLFIINNNVPSAVSNDGWAGFFGGYIGAIIGAISTIIAVSLEIKHNDKIRNEEKLREFRPYLYFEIDKIDDRKTSVYLHNLGKYAACEIKGYVLDNGQKKLVWNQFVCLDGNTKEKMVLPILKVGDLHIFEFKDILGQTYEQTVKCCAAEGLTEVELYCQEPILVPTVKI